MQPWGRPEDTDLLISTVPSGAADPLAELLEEFAWPGAAPLFDILYHPWPTRLAEVALAAGVPVIGGLELLAGQAVGQIELMTGRAVDVEILRVGGGARARAQLTRHGFGASVRRHSSGPGDSLARSARLNWSHARAVGGGDGSMFRERRERGTDSRVGAAHYLMRQKLFSIGDDYWIEDDRGQRVYKIDGKALRLRKTLIFEDAAGDRLLKIQERALRIRDTMEIEDRDGHQVASVKKALITPLRERWSVKVEHGPDLEVKGNVVDHEYTIEDGHPVGEVSKKWFRAADTYGVEVAPGQDPVLILAIAAVLDTMAHPDR